MATKEEIQQAQVDAVKKCKAKDNSCPCEVGIFSYRDHLDRATPWQAKQMAQQACSKISFEGYWLVSECKRGVELLDKELRSVGLRGAGLSGKKKRRR